MNAKGLVVLMIALTAVPAAAQTPPTPTPGEQLQRRYQIKVMEGVLVGAVRHGAELLAHQLKPYDPNVMLMTGVAHARGYVLSDYGVFFNVEIPSLRPSVAWTVQMMERDLGLNNALELLTRHIASIQDQNARRGLEQAVERLKLQVSPGAPASRSPERGTVSAASVDAAPTAPPRDPNAEYTDSVKHALIDAMLDHSGPMRIQPDEWLTVAASAAEERVPLPGETYDTVTIMLRIRGADLAAFRADRISKEEARKRVEVREF